MTGLLERLKNGVPQEEVRWPGNDGSDLVTDVSSANRTMADAASAIEALNLRQSAIIQILDGCNDMLKSNGFGSANIVELADRILLVCKDAE